MSPPDLRYQHKERWRSRVSPEMCILLATSFGGYPSKPNGPMMVMNVLIGSSRVVKRHDLLRGGLTGLAARVNLNHEREPEHPPASGNGGITRMDIVFEPTPDAIPSVAAAILCIATTIPCVSQERDEAEAVLRQAMANASGNGTALDEHKKVRCRVACHNGRTTVILSDPDSKPEPVLLSRPDPGSVVYAGRGCSIWLADDLGR